ncbi:MAG: hypothetical protein AB7I34_26695 [Rhizobiaceae bacterium]
MDETSKDENQDKGDEVLRRLLKTPPSPKLKPDAKKRRTEARRLPGSGEDDHKD